MKEGTIGAIGFFLILGSFLFIMFIALDSLVTAKRIAHSRSLVEVGFTIEEADAIARVREDD